MSSTLGDLGREVRALQDETLETRARPSVEQRLARVHAGVGRRGAPSRVSLARSLAVGAALGLAVASMGVWFFAPPASLSATARGGEVSVGALLSAATSEKLAISFSDGTTLRLEPDSRARIVRIDEHGAELALERGKLSAAVVPHVDARWVVAAGPFEIRVTGTRFDATWEPSNERLRVEMQEGSVRVSGACLSEPRALAAGDVSEFSCTERAAAETPRVREPDVATPPRSAPRPAIPAVAAPPGWRELARDARFKDALVAAEDAGFSGLCATLAAADVLELGNVARLAGNPARAAEAYLAARQRFAGSGTAASAAFQLGRIAFDGARDYGSARRWFAAYLSEQPGGGLAQEALGRLMESEHRSGDDAAARASAKQYLARFPTGAHAALAQSLSAE